MDELETRDTITPEGLELLRRELVEAFDRIRQHLTWAETMLVLSRHRVPKCTNSPEVGDANDGIAAYAPVGGRRPASRVRSPGSSRR